MDTLHALIGWQGESIGLSQMLLRASLIFLIGLVLARLAASRAFGKWSPLDIVLAVVVGSNLSRAMTGGAPFLPTVAATALLILLHALLARLAVRWPRFGRLIKGHAVQIVADGEPDPDAVRQAGIGHRDLEMAIRNAGHAGLKEIRSAWLERNGDITVVARSGVGTVPDD